MAIEFTCYCGQTIRVDDESAGRDVRCPSCAAEMLVPTPAMIDNDLEFGGEPFVAPAKLNSVETAAMYADRVLRPMPVNLFQPDFGLPTTNPYASPGRPAMHAQFEPKPATKPGQQVGVAMEEGWLAGFNGGISVGLLLIVISAVWFFGGLALGRIFFYPIFLVGAGIVSILQGIFGD